MKRTSRRRFLKMLGVGIGAVAAQQWLTGCTPQTSTQVPIVTNPPPTDLPLEPGQTDTPIQPSATSTSPSAEYPYMVVAHGDDPEKMVRQGIKAIGGMERFLKPGADVIIKPNICIPYHTYEFAATTNPWVVGALVKLCLEAGAGKVRVMDYPFGGSGPASYEGSGIEEQVLAAGGTMEVMQVLKYKRQQIPDALSLKDVEVYEDILKADLLIDVPIAKTHGMAGLTLGMKNLMGTILDRGSIHSSFEKKLVDLATLVKPHLTVIDAVRMLMANGPTGGNLNDVRLQNTVIFSRDIVCADSYAASLFEKTPDQISYIRKAEERGLGTADWKSVKVEEFNATT